MSTEIALNDEELNALMAELEAETGVSAEAPAPVKQAEPAVEEEDTSAMIEPADAAHLAELNNDPEYVKAEAEATVTVAEQPPFDVDAELASLEAEATKEIPDAEDVARMAALEQAREEVARQEAQAKAEKERQAELERKRQEEAKSAEAPAQAAPGGLQFYVDAEKFRDDTRVSEVNLDQCMVEQNGLRAYYGAQAAKAEAQHARLKVRFEVLEAQLYDEHRKSMAASGEKVTEKMVENAVKMDARWLKGKNRVIEAESIASINKALVQSLADRRDMIIQLGADRRDEYKGAARVLAEQQGRDDLRNRAINAAKVS